MRKVARVVHDIVMSAYQEQANTSFLQELLARYAATLEPWAERVARRMLLDVNDRSRQSWRALGSEISLGLKQELEEAPTGRAFSSLLLEQVGLITSIPREAAERVQKLATEALVNSTRAKALSEEIMRSGEVAKSRAVLIARTETSRAATTFVQARSQHIGSTHFVWRTSRDGAVRPSHKRLEGMTFRWDEPPECDPGYHALPGAIFNCRCYPEPLLPDPYSH